MLQVNLGSKVARNKRGERFAKMSQGKESSKKFETERQTYEIEMQVTRSGDASNPLKQRRPSREAKVGRNRA